MAAEIHLRAAIDGDKAALFSIHETLFREDIHRIWGWDEASQLANFNQEWEETELFVIEQETTLCGYLQQKRHPDHLHVLSLGLLPAFQSQGIGMEVLSWLKQEAKEQGIPIRLGVFPTNERALRFYLRHGFTIGEMSGTSVRLAWNPTPLTSG